MYQPDPDRLSTGKTSGAPMPFDVEAFTRTARELVEQNERVPEQRDSEAPYGWFDPEWVRVETTAFNDDGTITRSAGWVRREEWLASLQSVDGE